MSLIVEKNITSDQLWERLCRDYPGRFHGKNRLDVNGPLEGKNIVHLA